jgi:hypothetical protein
MLLPVLGMLGGCDDAPGPVERPVARAYENVLAWRDLRNAVPVDVSAEDSTAMAERFVRNWMEQQVLLHKAAENLAPEAMDLEARLRDYRNSLVIFAYEQAVVEQKLDTLVRQQEVEGYYQENRAAFELKESIARARWARVKDDDRRTMQQLRAHFHSGDPQRLHELELWIAERGHAIVDRSTQWTTVPELLATVPMAEPVEAGRTVVEREGHTWFVEVIELRTKGSLPPLELVQADIRAIIINQRKLLLIERMRQDLFREAIENKEIEVL